MLAACVAVLSQICLEYMSLQMVDYSAMNIIPASPLPRNLMKPSLSPASRAATTRRKSGGETHGEIVGK